MKKYIHNDYSYVSIVEISKDEIDSFDFAACRQPRETLASFYNRQKRKPEVLINAGFFSMSDGHPSFNLVDEGNIRAENSDYKIGMGTIKGKVNELIYGSLDDKSIEWKDFISGYPVLLAGNGPISIFKDGAEISYKAVRSCLAFNDESIFVIHIGKPGMTFSVMSRMLHRLGAAYAINLDGGGSARLLVNGSVFGSPTENRSVDNVLAIYLKEHNSEEVSAPADRPSKEVIADMPYIIYEVKKGDSWWKISTEFLGSGSKYRDLMLFNNNKSILHVGDLLKIPVNEKTYIVQSGDSWWSIARNQLGSGIRYKELAKYNNMTISQLIHAGDVIKIPV